MSAPEYVAMAARQQPDIAEPILADTFHKATAGERLLFLRRVLASAPEHEPNAYYYDNDGYVVTTKIAMSKIAVFHTNSVGHGRMSAAWLLRMNALPPGQVVNRTVARAGYASLHQATQIPDHDQRDQRTTRFYLANDQVAYGARLRKNGLVSALVRAERLPQCDMALGVVRTVAEAMGVPSQALAFSIDAVATDTRFALTHINTTPQRYQSKNLLSLAFPEAEVHAMLALRRMAEHRS